MTSKSDCPSCLIQAIAIATQAPPRAIYVQGVLVGAMAVLSEMTKDPHADVAVLMERALAPYCDRCNVLFGQYIEAIKTDARRKPCPGCPVCKPGSVQ